MSDTIDKTRSVTAPNKADHKPMREVATIGELFTNADFVRRIEKAVPSIITPTMMLSSLAGSLRKSPELAECSVADVAGKALMLAQAGLAPDTPLQLAHLIPFKEKTWNAASRVAEERTVCQVVIGYHGLLDLAFRSGKVASCVGRVVWRDEYDSRLFEYELGTNEFLRHVLSSKLHDLSPEAQARRDADMPVYAYAQAQLTSGSYRPFEVWPMPKVLAIRDETPAYKYARFRLGQAQEKGGRLPAAYLKAPWVAHLEKMAAKTMVRQLLNWLPRSVEYAAIAALDEVQERHTIDLGPIIDSTDYVSAASDAAEISEDPSATFGLRDNEDAPQDAPARRKPRSAQPSSPPPDIAHPAGGAPMASGASPSEPPPDNIPPNMGDEEAEPDTLEVPTLAGRGGTVWSVYLVKFREKTATIGAAHYLDFIAANIGRVREAPMSTRSLLIKVLVDRARALNVTPPAELSTALAPEPEPEQPAQPQQAQQAQQPQPAQKPLFDDPAPPAASDADRRIANNILDEIARCTATAQIEAYSISEAVKIPRNRWHNEGKTALFDEVTRAFKEKHAMLQGAKS